MCAYVCVNYSQSMYALLASMAYEPLLQCKLSMLANLLRVPASCYRGKPNPNSALFSVLCAWYNSHGGHAEETLKCVLEQLDLSVLYYKYFYKYVHEAMDVE